MEQTIIKMLDSNQVCDDCNSKNNKTIFTISSAKATVKCPYCRTESIKVPSVYQVKFRIFSCRTSKLYFCLILENFLH